MKIPLLEASTGWAMLLLIGPLPWWLLRSPEFKILWTVIISDAVLVVHLLMTFQASAKHLFHDKTVLKNQGTPKHILLDIARSMTFYAAFPTRIIFAYPPTCKR